MVSILLRKISSAQIQPFPFSLMLISPIYWSLPILMCCQKPLNRHHPENCVKRSTETPCDLSQGFLRHQRRFRRLPGGSRLLVWIGKTFGPTRSDSGDTEAAQEALRTRMFSGRFQGGRQARLHALPVNAQLAPGREDESDRIEHARQPGTIEIPLDQPITAESAVGTAVEPL